MSKIKKLLNKIYQNQKNFSFADFITLIEKFGFMRMRQKGSHVVYKHPELKKEDSFLIIQNHKGQAKSYQAKQFLDIIEKYNLEVKNVKK